MDRLLIGETIQAHRESIRITIPELATAANIRPAYLAAIEAGEVPGVTTRTLSKIADALNVPLNDLLIGTKPGGRSKNSLSLASRIAAATVLFSAFAACVLLVALAFALVSSVLTELILGFGK